MPNGRRHITGPAFTPRPYDLWSVVQAPPDGVDHWQMGVTWDSWCPVASTTYDPCLAVTGTGSAPPPPSKGSTTDRVPRAATPFTVFAWIECSAPGFWDSDAQAKITEIFENSEMKSVEAAFWTGSAGGQGTVFPHLAEDTALTVEGQLLQSQAVTGSATPLTPLNAIGMLEDMLGDCSIGTGVIHIPKNVLPMFYGTGYIRVEGDHLVTLGGNLVAVGAGYTGSSPLGTSTAGVTWVYGTGPVFGFRGDVLVIPPAQSFNRDINTVDALAERTYLLGWDCCHVAVPVNTGS